jgi:hypothetical protein
MNPLSKFTKPKQAVPVILASNLTTAAPVGKSSLTVVMDETKNPPVLSSEYVPAPEKCFCKVCKIHWTHPKAHVCACKMTHFGHSIVWLCLDCFNKIHCNSKVEIPEVDARLQAPYNEKAIAPKPAVKLPFKKLTK